MIVTDRKPLGVIKAQLEEINAKRIAVIACNACARICGTGGDKGLEEVSEALKKEGFNIAYKNVIPIMCDIDMIKKQINLEGDIDAIVSLGCAAGSFSLRKVFQDIPVIDGLDTIGVGARDEKGDIYVVKEVKR